MLRFLFPIVYYRARDPEELAGPLGTALGLAQRKRASARGEAGTSGFLSVSDSDRRVPAELGNTVRVRHHSCSFLFFFFKLTALINSQGSNQKNLMKRRASHVSVMKDKEKLINMTTKCDM